jgi:hypothetical protein
VGWGGSSGRLTVSLRAGRSHPLPLILLEFFVPGCLQKLALLEFPRFRDGSAQLVSICFLFFLFCPWWAEAVPSRDRPRGARPETARIPVEGAQELLGAVANCGPHDSPRAPGRERAREHREGGEWRGQWERAPGGWGAREVVGLGSPFWLGARTSPISAVRRQGRSSKLILTARARVPLGARVPSAASGGAGERRGQRER